MSSALARLRRQREPLSRDAIRVLRWHLVHAAGCVDLGCAAVQCYRLEPHELEWSEEGCEQLRRVRIPRSLRARLSCYLKRENSPTAEAVREKCPTECPRIRE